MDKGPCTFSMLLRSAHDIQLRQVPQIPPRRGYLCGGEIHDGRLANGIMLPSPPRVHDASARLCVPNGPRGSGRLRGCFPTSRLDGKESPARSGPYFNWEAAATENQQGRETGTLH